MNDMQARPDDEQPAERFAPQRLQHFFDPWLSTSSVLLQGVSANVAGALESAVDRQRGMKERDRENLRMMVQTVIANLAYSLANGGQPPGVAVSMRSAKKKLTRYDRRGFFSLPKILEAMSDKKIYLTLHKSQQKGISSAIIPDSQIAQFVEEWNIRPGNFFQQPGAETIVLSRTSQDFVEDTKSFEWIDYDDTEETQKLRQEMDQINRFLSQANLTMESAHPLAYPIRRRELRRFFKLSQSETSPRFDMGGRLFGAWWQTLPKVQRHLIRIEKQPIADLDFSNMFLRLAYLEAGVKPPPGDLYSMVPGPAIAEWRDVVKTVANAMLFRTKPLTRMPKDIPVPTNVLADIKGKDVRDAILTAHPAIASIFESGAGLRLMFVESQILIASLLRLADIGIVALPMHDGLMVQSFVGSQAETVMADVAKEITGFPLPVVRKTTKSL